MAKQQQPYHGIFGFHKSPAEITALMASTLSKEGYHLVSQSPELAVFETRPPSTVNYLLFGIFGATKSRTITMGFVQRDDGITTVTIDAESGGIGKLFEELREASVT
jgi:hypothetical protein